HAPLRKRRGRPRATRVLRGLPHRQDCRAHDLCQHGPAQEPAAQARALRHQHGAPGAATPPPRGEQPQHHL
ncbi:hypothetical protein BN1708_020280, partial [Verticillium longisporum]